MNNQRPACEDPHQGKDPKRRQVKPKEINYSTSVPEQEMAHMGWNLPVASQDLQGTGRYMAEILGIICIVLMSTVAKIAVLPYYFNVQATEGPEQNKTSLETMLQKACHSCHYLRQWFTYSNSCYYISPEKKSWNESWTSCASKNSSLLYSDDEEDMFSSKLFSLRTWIRVSHRRDQNSPVQAKGVTFASTELSVSSESEKNCPYAVLGIKRIYFVPCSEKKHYVCKHQIF